MRPLERIVLEGIVTGSVIVPVLEIDAIGELNVPVPEMVPKLESKPKLVKVMVPALETVPELESVPLLEIVPELVTVPPEFTVSVNPEGIVSK